MQDPATELRAVIRSLVEPVEAEAIQQNVAKYFASYGRIIHPLLNSPASAGVEGVLAAYQMLRVMTYDNRMTFHTVGMDKVVTRKGIDHVTCLIDCTEDLKLRYVFSLLPESLVPVFRPRFLVRVDMAKEADGLWRIVQQEDNIPSDFGRSGLAGALVSAPFNLVKLGMGVATLATATVFRQLNGVLF